MSLTNTGRIRRVTWPAFLACAVGLAWACGRPAPPDEPSEQAVEAPPPRPFQAPAPATRERPATPVATELSVSGDFAHEPHAQVSCTTCHPSVQGHSSHARVDCLACHPAPAPVRPLRAVTEEDCLACHHVRQRSRDCSYCHEVLSGRAFAVDQAVQVTARSTTVQRRLEFDHEWHAAVECGTCHGEGPRQPTAAACADCHEDHHTAASRCAGCHFPSPLELHDLEAHDGCSGAGCHDPRASEIPASRNLCLSCHPAQADHEPGGSCSLCHLLESRENGGAALGVGGFEPRPGRLP